MAKKQVSPAEEIDVYSVYSDVPSTVVDDGDQPTVNSVISGDDPDAIGAPPAPAPTTTPKPKPTSTSTTTEDVVEDAVEEEVVADPYVRPDYGRVEEPEYDDTAIPGIDVGEVTAGVVTAGEAPAYEISAAQKAWEESHAGRITDILSKGGLGIPEETQQLMKEKVFTDLKTREKESIRVLERDLEQRGIYNSNIYLSEKQKIRATTTRGLAAASTDIKIKSAFMKMASFENALGLSAQFLGYLSEQSQLAYAPKLETYRAQETAKLATFQAQEYAKIATYNAQVNAKLTTMQANVDIYKTKLHQAYATNNMSYAAEIAADAAHQAHLDNIVLAQMEIDAAKEQQKSELGANIFGTILGGISGLF